jgi:hypothetical protein
VSSRPKLDSRPTRGISGVVADMLGSRSSEVLNTKPPKVESVRAPSLKVEKPAKVKMNKPPNVNTSAREKTSFALLRGVKRHLTMLKLDLRFSGHRITEAEIVESLVSAATPESVLASLRKRPLS